MASMRLNHPAVKGVKIGRETVWKDRRPTVEQNKEKQRLKKLKKAT